MKKIIAICAFAAFVFVLSGCAIMSEATLFLVSKKSADGGKNIECNEFVVPIKKNVMGEATIEKAFNALLAVNPKDFGEEVFSSNGLSNFEIEEVAPQTFGTVEGYLVGFKQANDSKIVDKCEFSQIKEQITETVRAAAKDAPFVIRLNGEPKNWECFGSDKPDCK